MKEKTLNVWSAYSGRLRRSCGEFEIKVHRQLKTMTAALCMTLATLPLATAGWAAATAATTQTPAPVWRTDVMGSGTAQLPLLSLVPGGVTRTVRLSGLETTQYFDFGMRMDEVVTRATLNLAFTVSAAVLPTVSQVNVRLNGELQQSITLDASMIGKPAQVTVLLSPKAMRSSNQIALEFIGHVQTRCENPADASVWLDVGPASRLVLEKSNIRLGNDLALLPAPFVDTLTNARTRLNLVFPGAPSATLKEAAALVAGWAGQAAGWRGAEFPVSFGANPGPGHAVVFVTKDQCPTFLRDMPELADLAHISGPQLFMLDAPGSLTDKLLVLAGRDEKEVVTAARALMGTNAMIGATYRPTRVVEAPRRAAWDAPAWLPLDRTVPFSRLMEYPGQLSAQGAVMPPVELPVRLPPDLFMTGDASMVLSLKYRATKPMTGEAAQFRALLNGALLDSESMVARDGTGARTVMLPGFYGALIDNPEGALALRQTNRLGFRVDYERILDAGTTQSCRSVVMLPHQMEMDPASTIRIEGAWHRAQLPDLRLFAQAGFPFTKYADLAETAVVIRDDASESDVSVMLTALGRLAAQTGVAGGRVVVTANLNDPRLHERDLLVIGPVLTRMTDITDAAAEELVGTLGETLKSGASVKAEKSGSATLTAPEGQVIADPVAVVAQLASPLARGRSVVALLSEGPAAADALVDALASPASLGALKGAVGVFGVPGMGPSAEAPATFRAGEDYVVSDLPWYHEVWMRLTQHPGWIVVAALLSALVIGLSIFLFMRRWVGKRA